MIIDALGILPIRHKGLELVILVDDRKTEFLRHCNFSTSRGQVDWVSYHHTMRLEPYMHSDVTLVRP